MIELMLVRHRYFDDLRAVLKKDCAMYDKTLECYQLGQFYEVAYFSIAMSGRVSNCSCCRLC